MHEFERFYRDVGKRIAKARRQGSERITQESLAARIGLSRTSIANIERGRQQILVHHLVAIARSLGVEPGSLLPPPETPHPELVAILQKVRVGREWIERSLATTLDGVSKEQKEKGDMNEDSTARHSSNGHRSAGSKRGEARAGTRRTDRAKPRR